jgi:hypothetical protein
LASRAAEEIFLKVQMTGVTGDLQQATMRAALIVGAFGMDNSFISYLPMGVGGLYQAATSGGDVKARVDKILHEEYRKVKAMVDANKEAVIAIAEALILRNELTDIDVNEILARIEAEHPFVNPNKQPETRSFGFIGNQALPAPEAPLRRNTNGKPIVTEPVVAPMAQQPATEPPPSAPAPDSERPSE